MKLFKFSSISFLVFFSFVLSTPVFALTAPVKYNLVETTILAEVNIYDAKIVSEKDNVFNISFTLSNGKGLQTGVRYGVELLSTDPKEPTVIIDEKIYPEVLTLGENINKKIDVIYEAPSMLTGTYRLVIVSKNSSGFPFGISSLKEIKFINTEKNVQIMPESCSISVVGKDNDKYKLGQVSSIKPEEEIKLSCTVVNNLDDSVTLTPVILTKADSEFGEDVIIANAPKLEPISLSAKEKKNISIILPKSVSPKMYFTKIGLNYLDKFSNFINLRYMVSGKIASIDNFFFDKDYYSKGEIANTFFVWTYMSPQKDISKGVILNSLMTNGKGKACSSPLSFNIVKDLNPKTILSIPIIKSCFNPTVTISLKDLNGNTLDEKVFKAETISVKENNTNNNILYVIIFIILLILVLVIVYYLKKKKSNLSKIDDQDKSNNIPLNVIISFILFLSFFSLISIKEVSASSFSFNSGSGCSAYGSVGLDKSSYPTSAVIFVNGNITDSCGQYVGIKANNYANNYAGTDKIVAPGYYSSSQGSNVMFYANSYGGSSTIAFSLYAGQSSSTAYVSYSVSVPVNPTVTISASKNTMVVGESVNISWISYDANSCSCTYNGTSGDCGTSTVNGSAQSASNNPYTLQQTKTFTVTCTN